MGIGRKENKGDLIIEFDIKFPKKLTNHQIDIICNKISKIHKLNYIHNDLHWGNIFVHTENGKDIPYIIDWGLSLNVKPGSNTKYNSLGYDFNGPHLKNHFNLFYLWSLI